MSDIINCPNCSVIERQIRAVLDCFVHQSFDLAHNKVPMVECYLESRYSVYNAEQSCEFRLQCVQHNCILLSVKVVLILTESSINQVPLISGEIFANGEKIRASEHVCLFSLVAYTTGTIRS